MKTCQFLAAFVLFVLITSQSFALMKVGKVSAERAEELGIEIRARPGGPKHAWVELEFKLQGELEKFHHVSLEISDGGELAMGWTPLKDKRTTNGNVIVRVMGGRAFLEKVTLRIVVGDFADRDWDVHLKEFVDFKKFASPEPAAAAEVESQGKMEPKPESDEDSE